MKESNAEKDPSGDGFLKSGPVEVLFSESFGEIESLPSEFWDEFRSLLSMREDPWTDLVPVLVRAFVRFTETGTDLAERRSRMTHLQKLSVMENAPSVFREAFFRFFFQRIQNEFQECERAWLGEFLIAVPFLISFSGELQELLADRLLHFLQTSAKPEVRQRVLEALLYLAENSPVSLTVYRDCARAIQVQLKLCRTPEERAVLLSKLAAFCNAFPKDPELRYTRAQAAVYLLECCETSKETLAQLDVLRRLAELSVSEQSGMCIFGTEKIRRLFAQGLFLMLRHSQRASERDFFLLELKHLAESEPEDRQISEFYVRGVASVLQSVREPDERNAWFQALEKFTEQEGLTSEMKAGVLEGGTYWLIGRLSESEAALKISREKVQEWETRKTADCRRIQELLCRLWSKKDQNAAFRYFFACALLLSMNGESSVEKRKSWASQLAECRSVRLTELDELYRTCRSWFLANEWDEDVRKSILSALR